MRAVLHNVSDNTIQGMRTQTRRMLVTLGATAKNFLFVSLEKVDFYGGLFLRKSDKSISFGKPLGVLHMVIS